MPKQNKQPRSNPKSVRRHHWWLAFIGVVLVATCFVIGSLTHGDVKHVSQQEVIAVDAPLEIRFDKRYLRILPENITVEPAIVGEWTIEPSILGGDKLQFTHTQPLAADTDYLVTLHDVRSVLGVPIEVPSIHFVTEAAPGLTYVSFENGATVPADATFEVTLSPQNRGQRDLILEAEPQVETTRTVQDESVFMWKPKSILPQGSDLQLRVLDAKTGETLVKRIVKVAAAPSLESKPPEVGFGKNDKVTLVFAVPIDPNSGTINFSVEGNGAWQDNRAYVFTPNSVSPGTTYTYTLPKGLRTTEGGIITEDQVYQFATPGSVAVVGFSPRGYELSQARQVIRVTFDQPVDKRSAEERVAVSRGNVIARTWEGNTLALTATDFGTQETVSVSVAPGVQPVFGLPSNAPFGYSFTTEIPVYKLPVPMYYQQYAQSCESASLRMALAYRGIYDSDWNILQRFGYNPRPMDKDNNIWDDPQQQFVGDVNGNQGAGTGWGVYAGPVASATQSYGRGASVQYGVSAAYVAQNIYAGNPVILWGIWNESASQRSWTTPGGRTVSGPVPMHVRLVVGVKGRPDNPVGFYIHDPITGPTYWTASYMVYNAQRAGAANMAVAVQ